jgi:hypothetical protein
VQQNANSGFQMGGGAGIPIPHPWELPFLQSCNLRCGNELIIVLTSLPMSESLQLHDWHLLARLSSAQQTCRDAQWLT